MGMKRHISMPSKNEGDQMKMKEMKLLAILTVMVMAFAAFATISDSSEDEGDVSYEAKIGSTYYETFTEAIGAATSGETVDVLTDCEYTNTTICPLLTNADGVTVEGNDNTITMKIPNVDLRNGTVFNSVVFYGSFTEGTGNLFNVYGDSEGYTLTGSKDLTFNKCSFTGDGCVDNYIQFGNTNSASGKLSVTDCSFDNTNCKNRDIRVVFIDSATTAESHVTVTGCTLTAFDPQAEDKNTPVKISGKTDAGFYTMTGNTIAGKELKAYKTEGAVVLAEASYFAVKIGDIYYETLSKALSSVASDSEVTITLLRDCSDEGMSVSGDNKKITIDFKEFTFTSLAPGAGSKNTQTQAFQFDVNGEASLITLMNGTIKVDPSNKSIVGTPDDQSNPCIWLINSYSNLIVNNMTIDGTYLNSQDKSGQVGGNYTIVINQNDRGLAIQNSTIISDPANNGIAVSINDDSGQLRTTAVGIINGGTFIGPVVLGQYAKSLTINGGTFSDLSGLQYMVEGYDYELSNSVTTADKVTVKENVDLKIVSGKTVTLDDKTNSDVKMVIEKGASVTGKVAFSSDSKYVQLDGLKAGNEPIFIEHGSIIISGTIDASNVVTIDSNGNVKLNDVIIADEGIGSLILTKTGTDSSIVIDNLKISSGATLDITKDAIIESKIDMGAGSALIVRENATLKITKDSVMDNNGEVTVKSSGKIVNEGTVDSSESTGKIINQGTIENKNGGEITDKVDVANYRTITVVPNYEIRGTATADKTEAREGETIALHATPAAGYLFSEWKCVGIASVGPDNTFIMPATAVTITAVFVEDTRHIITVEKVGEGQATASIDKELKGQTVTLAAVPEDGYVFSTWQSSDVTITNPTSEIASFVMPDKAVTIKAVFAKLYTITVTSDGHGTAKTVGSITQAIAGKKIALSTTADDGYGFKDWQSSDVTVGSDNTFTMPEKNVTVKATFDKVYNINITTDGNGTVTASPEKQVAGKTVKLTDRPKSGYYLSELKVDGQTITTGSFVMPAADVSVTASFEPYAAIIKVVENGSVTLSAALTEYLRITDESKLVLTIDYIPNPSQPNIPKDALAFNISLTYDGRSVTKFVPNIYVTLNYEAAAGEVIDGYDVYYVSANGGVVEDMNAVYQDDAFAFSASHFSTFVISPTVIEPVIFKHPITVLTDGSGTASANKVQAAVNEVVTVTAVPADGYAFAGWISEDVDFMDATKNQTTFLMMDNSVTVTAMFIDKYDITVKIEGKGTASAIPSKALAGETVRLTATSESGYYFSEWKSETEGVKIVNGQFVMPESDVTVKAVFVAYTDVTKSTANGSVTIPAALAEKYGMKDSTGLILTISKISKPAQSNIPKDALAYDISLTYNGKELTSFAQKIEIKINYDIASGQSIVGWDVYYVSDDGKTVEDMNSTYKNKGFVFETDHLSTYVISPTVIEPVKEAQDHSLLMIIVAIIAAIVVVAAVLLIVWKKNQTI